MAYRVIISDIAQEELESSFLHILHEFTNPHAAKLFLEDALATINRLSIMADSFPVCEEPYLKEAGCRVIHFKKYRYKIVYRIVGKRVEIDGIYHNLQDFSNRYKEDYPLE